MNMTVKIKGMMCVHCVRAVKKAQEGIPGVSAEVTLEDGTAVLHSEGTIDAAAVRKAVTDAGYEVTEIA